MTLGGLLRSSRGAVAAAAMPPLLFLSSCHSLEGPSLSAAGAYVKTSNIPGLGIVDRAVIGTFLDVLGGQRNAVLAAREGRSDVHVHVPYQQPGQQHNASATTNTPHATMELYRWSDSNRDGVPTWDELRPAGNRANLDALGLVVGYTSSHRGPVDFIIRSANGSVLSRDRPTKTDNTMYKAFPKGSSLSLQNPLTTDQKFRQAGAHQFETGTGSQFVRRDITIYRNTSVAPTPSR